MIIVPDMPCNCGRSPHTTTCDTQCGRWIITPPEVPGQPREVAERSVQRPAPWDALVAYLSASGRAFLCSEIRLLGRARNGSTAVFEVAGRRWVVTFVEGS